MRVKGNSYKASQPRIKVVMVKQGDGYITHIYRSRDCFRLDELACYKCKAFRTLEVIASASTAKENKKTKTE